MSETLRVPLLISERAGLTRRAEPVRLGVPFARGQLRDETRVRLVDGSERGLPAQVRSLATWPDGSIKWLLVDTLVSSEPHQRQTVWVRAAASAEPEPHVNSLRIEADSGSHRIDTGPAVFEIGARETVLFDVYRAGERLLTPSGARLRLVGCRGREYQALWDRCYVEEAGPIRAALICEGHFRAGGNRSRLRCRTRYILTAGSSRLRLEVLVHNPQAAAHPGGLWDLNDRGTILFEDLSLDLAPAAPCDGLRWYADPTGTSHSAAPAEWLLYQDSSGGVNWDSPNHIDGRGNSTVSFRGYRVSYNDMTGPMLVAEGDRAVPSLCARSGAGEIAMTTLGFWQNFPKALRWRAGALSAGLFPGECPAPFALQGGEQKQHTVVLEFLQPGEPSAIPAEQQPLEACIDPAWVERTGALACFVPASRDPNEHYLRYINAIVDGPHSFAAKREQIDEYGWRNYGDLYADHEAVGHAGPRPMISHYNNQYDFIHGALVHFLRSADRRWWDLAVAGAQHTIDIDIYHTDRDKAAFNHGLFWHTDHHKPAATCTHRTYSRQNGRSRRYGGGPSNEHNYTSGLLTYFYLSGDQDTAHAVRELAEWVCAMDDGTNTVLGLIDPGPTGLASQTADPSYHKAGRGGGNSINALLDAYELCRERRYLDKAEELIRRCIHPADDIEVLGLSDPEHRWSYLVFLQVLGKYLHIKLDWNERDYTFYYGCASLLHYANWIAQHEVPYKQVLHKLDLPTETWPAHDVRKCHILHLAADFAPPGERARLRERAAFFFDSSLEDVLSFKTAFLTRPLVILCNYGYQHAYYRLHPEVGIELEESPYSFGEPQPFTPQRRRWRAAWPARLRLLVSQLTRASAEWLDPLGRRSTPSRL
jgi:hypothetical protein